MITGKNYGWMEKIKLYWKMCNFSTLFVGIWKARRHCLVIINIWFNNFWWILNMSYEEKSLIIGSGAIGQWTLQSFVKVKIHQFVFKLNPDFINFIDTFNLSSSLLIECENQLLFSVFVENSLNFTEFAWAKQDTNCYHFYIYVESNIFLCGSKYTTTHLTITRNWRWLW